MPVNAQMTFQTYEPLQLNQSKITLQSGERHLGRSFKLNRFPKRKDEDAEMHLNTFQFKKDKEVEDVWGISATGGII